MITLTFGAGGTYANLIAAIAGAALPVSPAPLPDDYTFLQVGDSTENATVLFTNIENNKKIYVTTDTPHNMNPNVGHLMSLSPGSNYGWWILAGDIYVHGLHTKRVDVLGSINPVSFHCQYNPWGAPIVRVDFYDNILDGNEIEGAGIQAGAPINDGLGRFRIYNNKIYGCSANVGCAIALDEEYLIENNTLYKAVYNINYRGIDFGNAGASNAIARNNVAANHGIDYRRTGVAYTMENNASKDATGDAGLTGIVEADEFESLNELSDDFLRLKDGAVAGSFTRDPPGVLKVKQDCKFTPSVQFNPGSPVLGQGGSAPSLATLDGEGFARPGVDSLYSIGCHEQQYS